MRLGWYSRLVIVLMVFWTVGKGAHENNNNYWAGIEAQARDLTTCFDADARKWPLAGRRPGEDCAAYAGRQFQWMFGWQSLSNELTKASVQAAFLGLISIILYWAARWIWAGRPGGWPRRSPN